MRRAVNYRVDHDKRYRIKTSLEGRPGTDDKLDCVIGYMQCEYSQDDWVYEVAIVSDLTGRTFYVSPQDIEAVE